MSNSKYRKDRKRQLSPPEKHVHTPPFVDHGPTTLILHSVQVFSETAGTEAVPAAPNVDPDDIACLANFETGAGEYAMGLFGREWQHFLLENLGEDVELTLIPTTRGPELPMVFPVSPEVVRAARSTLNSCERGS